MRRHHFRSFVWLGLIAAVLLSCDGAATPTTAPPTKPPPVTPSAGSIIGRVTVQAPPNPPQAVDQAQIGLVDLPGIATTSDHTGAYQLSGVPNGQHFVYAQTKFGMSNIQSVNVSGSSTTQDIQILTFLPIIQIGIAHGRVQTEDGKPVAGATVWIFGDLARTASEADGTFQLVDPVPARTVSTAFIAVAGNRWGMAPESSGGALPVITLNRKLPAPAPPVLVFDFVAHAAEAAWRNGSNVLVWNLPDNDSRGFALYRHGMELEDGSRPARFLETHPQWIVGGTITGAFPQNLTLQKGDYLVARIGFMKGANAGRARFHVTFAPAGPGIKIISSIAEMEKPYTGNLGALVAQVPDSLAGVPGNIRLAVDAGTTAAQDWAVWAEAQIVRAK